MQLAAAECLDRPLASGNQPTEWESFTGFTIVKLSDGAKQRDRERERERLVLPK